MTSRYRLTVFVSLVAVVAAAATGVTGAEDEQLLIAILQSDAPQAEKALVCKRLAVHGTTAAVPSLAKLLSDRELASWARIALEAIPDSTADVALREVLERVDGRLRIGVINSIGVRRDQLAVDPLLEQLQDDDEQVASAAAVALGKIGNAQATAALSSSLAAAPEPVRSAVAEGCILCAERLLTAGNLNAAAELYDQVRTADVPKQRVVEATRGAILARQDDGIPLMIEQLGSDDKALFEMGLSTSRELMSSKVTESLVSALMAAPRERQAVLLMALADRRDAATLPAVLQLARTGFRPTRIAALGVLDQVGNASCVPLLLELAVADDAELSGAAKAAIEKLPDDDVDVDLVARLEQVAGRTREVVIELIGLRRIDAVPAILDAAEEADPRIRAAALLALGATVGPENLDYLIARVVSPRHVQETKVARQALLAAAVRMPDCDACAEQLAGSMSQAPLQVQIALLEVLGAVGGGRSLAVVAAAAKDKNPRLQDNASRLLGQWMTADAAPVLLELAQTAASDKYRVRSLRGYIRIARQFTMPDDERAAMCHAAWETATRDDERKLVLQVLRRYPNIEMLRLAVTAAQLSSLKVDATQTAMKIIKKMGGDGVDVEQLLDQIDEGLVKIEITKAEYGADTTYADVTEEIRRHLLDFPIIVLPTSNYNETFGSDPLPGVPKELKVEYRINGKPGRATFAENSVILLLSLE